MPDRPATWDDLVRHEAGKAKVPHQLALAVMQQESGGRPDVTSEVGAHGLFQLMPATAKGLGVDAADPVQNIRGGVTYLRQLLDANQGDVSKALASYHGGPDLAQHGPKTSAYVQSILGRLQATPAAPIATAPVGKAPVSSVVTRGVPAVGQPPPPPDPRQFEPPPAYTGGIEGSRFDPAVKAAQVGQPPGMLASMAEGFDPRQPAGRRNLAAGAGALTGALLTRSPVGTRAGATLGARVAMAAPRMLASAAGAGVGGAAAEAGEQVVGTAPPDVGAIAKAGVTQAAYEVAGAAFLWLPRAVGRRVISSRVGREAAQQLGRAKQGVVDQTQAAITAVKDLTRRTTQGLSTRLGAVVGQPPPSPSAVGRAAQEVIGGPARTARDLAGQAVETAAQGGPAVDIRALKSEVQRILSTEIKPPATAFPREPIAGAGEEAATAAGLSPEVAQRILAKGGPSAVAMQEAIDAAQGEAEQAILKHPALGVINRILNAEDTVPFAAAHQFKRELDDAVGATWDRSVQKRVTNITKTLRGTLREALGVHAPYNRATTHYATIAPLYTKEIAPRLRKLAATRPEALISLIKGGEPTPAKMLRELLTTQAEAGGGGPEGRAAWDQVRASWTHEKILRGGLDKLDANIAKLDPEFADIFYGDASGQQVLANMKTIGTAYRQALAREPVALQQAKVTGREALERARLEITRFTESSLGRKPKAGEVEADILRAAMVPTTFWGAYSIGRLLKGPRVADLIEWAAYSPPNTQKLVRAFTSPVPAVAIADLLRAGTEPTKRTLSGGAPPPLPSVIGAPPP